MGANSWWPRFLHVLCQLIGVDASQSYEQGRPEAAAETMKGGLVRSR